MPAKQQGGSQASDSVLSSVHQMWPIFHMEGGSRRSRTNKAQHGGAEESCNSPAPADLVNTVGSLTSATVPVAIPGTVPGATNYASIPYSTMSLMNADLTNFGELSNTFNFTGQFTPPLLSGGCASCAICKRNQNTKACSKRKTRRQTRKY